MTSSRWRTSEEIQLGTRHRINSEILGEERDVLVRIPGVYDRSREAYPVFVLLDAEPALFLGGVGTVVQASEWEAAIPEMIMVGVPNTDRIRDMLPTVATLQDERTHGGPGSPFLSFLIDELLPAVDAEFRTQPYRVLAGTSASALTAVFAMLSRPGGFSAYLASSPCLDWDDRLVFRRLEEFDIQQFPVETSLALWYGENDNAGTGDACRAFDTALHGKKVSGLRWMCRRYDGAGHCPVDGFRHALAWTFEPWRVNEETLNQGIRGIARHYRGLSDRLGFEVTLSDAAHGDLAYRIMVQRGRPEDAVQWMQAVCEDHAPSADLAFYHAFALQRANRLDDARAITRQALERDPENARLQSLAVSLH